MEKFLGYFKNKLFNHIKHCISESDPLAQVYKVKYLYAFCIQNICEKICNSEEFSMHAQCCHGMDKALSPDLNHTKHPWHELTEIVSLAHLSNISA